MLNTAHYNMQPEVATWISKANANGGVYTSQTVNALNKLITDIERYGLRSKIFRLNMFVGQNSNAGKIPIIADKGNSIDTIVGSPLYTPNGGFNPNNSNNTNYIKTGVFPSVHFTQASSHQGCWVFTPYNNTMTSQQGCTDFSGGANRCALHYPWNDGNVYSDMYGVANGTSRSFTSSFANGTLLQNLICSVNAGSNRIYRNGIPATLSSTGTGAGTMPTTEYAILNSMGPGNSPNGAMFNNYRIGYYTLGTGLTAADSFLYNKAVSDFMTLLGRS